MSVDKQLLVEQWLVRRLAELLGKPVSHFDSGTRLDNIGLDSLSEAGLALEIETKFGVTINPKVLIRHPTVSSIASYVSTQSVRNKQ